MICRDEEDDLKCRLYAESINTKITNQQNNETTFKFVEDQVEKIDYNFFQKMDQSLVDPSEVAQILKQNNKIPICEESAFNLYNLIFKSGVNDIELFKPGNLVKRE